MFHTNSTIIEKESDTLDVVIIVGKDRESESFMQECVHNVKTACKNRNLTFYIVGDGESKVDPAAISKLKKATHVIILGHGSAEKNEHYIDIFKNHSNISYHIIQQVQTQTGAKNILLCACFGGKVVYDIRNCPYPVLQQGTSLFIPSPKDEVSFIDNNNKIIYDFINKISPSKTTSMLSLYADTIKSIPDTMVYFHQPEYQYKTVSHVTKRQDREVYLEVDKYYEYRINTLNDFINEIVFDGECHSLISELQENFPGFEQYREKLMLSYSREKLAPSHNVTSLMSVTMSPEERESFQAISLLNYIAHNDVNIVDALLKNNRFTIDLLAIAIISHAEKYHKEDMSSIVEVLLKHGSHCRLVQNVNTFASDMTLADYYSLYDIHGFKAFIFLMYTPLTLALTNGDINIGPINIINLKPINTGVVKILLDKGADIYLSDSLGNIPAGFLRQSWYQDLFIDKFEELKEIRYFMVYAEAILNGLNDKEKIEHKEMFDKIKNVFFKYDEWKRLSELNNDMDLFKDKDKVYPPTTKEVFNAYTGFLKSANEIQVKDLFAIAEKSHSGLMDKLINIKPLYQLLRDEKPEYIPTLINNGMNVTIREPGTFQSPLYIAVNHSYVDIVKLLISRNIKLTDYDKEAILFPAIERMPEMVDIFLRMGAVKDSRYKEMWTPLQYAIWYRRFDLIPLLHTRPFDLNTRERQSGMYPIFKVIQDGTIQDLEILLVLGANVNVEYSGQSPVMYAIKCNKPEFVAFLLKSNPEALKSLDNEGHSLLYLAANNMECFKLLLEKGMTWKDQEEVQAFVSSCTYNDACKFQVKNYIDPYFTDENGNNILHRVLLSKAPDAIKTTFLADYVNINAANQDGDTALHLAVLRGDDVMVQILIDKGADIFAKNKQGKMASELLPVREELEKLEKIRINKIQILKKAELTLLLKEFIAQPLINFINRILINETDVTLVSKLTSIINNIHQENSLSTQVNTYHYEKWFTEIIQLLPRREDLEWITMEVRQRIIKTSSEMPMQESLKKILEDQRLTLISKLQHQVKLNTDMLGRTADPDKKEILHHLLHMLFYKNLEDKNLNDKLQKFPMLAELSIQVTEHLKETAKINKIFEKKVEPVSQLENKKGMTY